MRELPEMLLYQHKYTLKMGNYDEAVEDYLQRVEENRPYEDVVDKTEFDRKYMNQWTTQSMTDCVTEFHRTYGQPVAKTPALIDHERFLLRLNLIEEELDEFVHAAVDYDLTGIADALGDLIYVVIGAALEYGIPIDEVVTEIHRSNLSKLDENGKPIYRKSDGKVLKGPNYSPPVLKPILYPNG